MGVCRHAPVQYFYFEASRAAGLTHVLFETTHQYILAYQVILCDLKEISETASERFI